ncbi:hypothetical protein [Campylobacter devanensis]|uniref:hypothetical protein n=1 Tax=Campylobacter devanensis TaxID=3161138 RepID=UPI0015D730EB|nr:hypothetical protein [Campylobacter sp. P0139]
MDKNKTSIKKEIEEQKSSVKTINFSTQIEKIKIQRWKKWKYVRIVVLSLEMIRTIGS